MYLVLTKQNLADSTIPSVAPRLITSMPQRALAAARETYKDGHACFVSRVIIYKMDHECIYSMDAAAKSADCIVAFVAWCDEEGWRENFYDSDLAAIAAAG